MTEEQFQLRNDQPRSARTQFGNDRTHQRVLFSGLDCSAGQQDLWDDMDLAPDEEDDVPSLRDWLDYCDHTHINGEKD